MDQIRKSKNFQRNFLSRRQKIILQFDKSNIIERVHDSGSDNEVKEDIDTQLLKNLDSQNKMVLIFTAAKILKILIPYIKETQLAEFDKNLFYSFFLKKFV